MDSRTRPLPIKHSRIAVDSPLARPCRDQLDAGTRRFPLRPLASIEPAEHTNRPHGATGGKRSEVRAFETKVREQVLCESDVDRRTTFDTRAEVGVRLARTNSHGIELHW